MFRNFLVIAIRNLLKHRFYSFLNIISLAIGIACVVLIMLYVSDQFGYDVQQVNRDRIYRVMQEFKSEDGQRTYKHRVSGAVGPALAQEFPEIEAAVRFMPRSVWIRHEDRIFNQVFCLVDPNFLDVFTFPMVTGDKTALSQPQSVLITESAARKYCGVENPIGKTVSVEGSYIAGDYVIAGVIRDASNHSTMKFDFLSASVQSRFSAWNEFLPNTTYPVISVYLILKDGASAKSLESKLPSFIKRHTDTINGSSNYYLQPLTDIYLHSVDDYGLRETSEMEDGIKYGSISHVYTALFLAFFIMLIACINFVNLATARSASRAKEVGLRKVVGAGRKHIALQFFGESLILTILSLFVALCVIELGLPLFNDFSTLNLSFNLTWSYMLQLAGLTLIVSSITGWYPALYLSHFHPIQAMQGKISVGTKSGILRKILVIFQFGISVVLIVIAMLTFKQNTYLKNKNLGYVKDHIIELPIFWQHRNSSEKGHPLWMRYKTVKETFLQHPNVKLATISRFPHGISTPLSFFKTYQSGSHEWQMQLNEVDEDFITTLNIELVSGRNFSDNATFNALIASGRVRSVISRASPNTKEQNFKANASQPLSLSTPESEYILNETAVKMLGWKNPIGQSFGLKDQKPGRVIGIVKDFHTRSLHEPIQPTVLYASNAVPKILYLKISPDHIEETIGFLKKTWNDFLPSRPFTYTFLDENLNQQYENEHQFSNSMSLFSLLAIFIACLGLLGLISFMAEQRSKEVGIRKVFGASETNIVLLLTTESFKLVFISCLLAWPIAYFAIQQWLEGFAYRIDITVVPFLFGGASAFILSILVVMYQALKAARKNPIDVLRNE